MPVFQKFCIEHLLFPAMERLKGNHIRAKIAELQSTEFAPDVMERQRQALARLLRHCAAHVPAYRSLQLTEQEIRDDPYRVLAERVPALHKTDFRLNDQKYLADNIDPASRIANFTGGSTGEPVHFFMTRDQVESYEAARWRGLSWYGISPGSRSVMVWGNPVELSAHEEKKYWIREQLLKNRKMIPAYALSDADTAKQVRLLQRYQPEYLYGFSSILVAFARNIQQQRLSVHLPLKAVVSTSETLAPEQAALLRDVFHCPIANEYGARDEGILAYSCPKGRLHITAENCVIEVLDPLTLQPLPHGKSGLLAITDLRNFVQPRLRYMVGDVGVLGTALCSCGRTLPVLETIEGREDALLIGRDGVLVHGDLVGHILRPLTWVRAFQFRQHSPIAATLFIVVMPGKELVKDDFFPTLQGIFPNTKITIQEVDHIEPAPSGKMRYSIREFNLPNTP